MNEISLGQLRQAKPKLLALLSTKREWVLTRYGKPFARIQPLLNTYATAEAIEKVNNDRPNQ